MRQALILFFVSFVLVSTIGATVDLQRSPLRGFQRSGFIESLDITDMRATLVVGAKYSGEHSTAEQRTGLIHFVHRYATRRQPRVQSLEVRDLQGRLLGTYSESNL